MEKNKIIIIALIVVIVVLLVGIAATTMPNVNKKDTNVTYKGKSKITEGDTINLKLTDVNGTPLANQTVNITITDKDKSSSYYSVVTNAKGIAKLKSDKSAGNYTVFINYGGNENYTGCNFTKKIVIEKEVVEATVEQSSSGSSSGTHVVIGEDGYYALLDDNGNFLENLGPSKKYYPNNPNAVDYPNAGHWYVDKSKSRVK